MPNRVPFQSWRFYHLYNRGTDKRVIFHDESDWRRFLLGLIASNGQLPVKSADLREKSPEELAAKRGQTLIDLCAYCLMPNHFHLVVRVKKGVDTGKFLRKHLIGYTMYFNRKYGRSGVLFQGRTKSKLIKDARHLITLLAYVNENPLELLAPGADSTAAQDVSAVLAAYPFASYRDYATPDARAERAALEFSLLPRHIGAALKFRRDAISFGGASG